MADDGREGGFIVLHRRIRSWALWHFMSAEQRMVWVQILLDANWKDSEVWHGSQRFTVKRGQLIHSERTLARNAGVSRKVVRTSLEKLTAEGAILRSNIGQVQIDGGHEKGPVEGPAPHVITVVNYSKYQDVTEDEGPAAGPSEAQQGPKEGPRRALSEPVEQEEPTTAPLFAARECDAPAPANGGGETQATQPQASPPPKPKRLSPQGEAYEHWKENVWWRLSTAPCPKLTDKSAVLLAALCRMHGVGGVTAAMDRVVEKLERGDEKARGWLRENLTLPTFCAEGVFAKFLPRAAAPVAAHRKATDREITGFDSDGMPTYAEKRTA